MILRWRILSLLSFILLLQLSIAEECIKDIAEDICPQREGFDADCERRCMQQYPLRMGSACRLRSTGTLLSFFGIRSFSCRCILPSSYCDSTTVLNALSPARLQFSLPAIKLHSTIERLEGDQSCALSPSPFDLSCTASFEGCGWHRSSGADWFSAREHGILPFSPQEAPNGEYLIAVSQEGITNITLETCPGLCSKEDVNVTMRVWRAPWVVVELCFSEQGDAMCAPVKTPNGRTITEVIPSTESFRISFRFSNLTMGDAVLVDDLSTLFEPCPLAQRMHNSLLSLPSTPLSHIPTSPFRTASMNPSKQSPMAPSPPSPPAPSFPSQPLPSLQGISQFPQQMIPSPMMIASSQGGMSAQSFLPIGPTPMRGISRPIPPTTTIPPPIMLPDDQSFIPIGGLPHIASLPSPASTRFVSPSVIPHFPSSSVDSTARVPVRTREGTGVMLTEVRGKTVHTATAVRKSGGERCKDVDCRTANLDRTCIGRAAHIKCQAKCRDQGNGGQSARCVRENEYPFTRRCVCLPRRAPSTIDSRSNEITEEVVHSSTDHLSIPFSTPPSIEGEASLLSHQPSSSMTHSKEGEDNIRSHASSAERTVASRFRSSHELAVPSASSVEEILTLTDDEGGSSEQSVESRRVNLLETALTCGREADCAEQCEEDSTPVCRGGECVCNKCAKHMCDFEKRGECGWSDLRALSPQFNNISVASKKGQDNRYGLSRMVPRSYSGLLRRAPISGPISLSVDLFPSHNMEVKICVHTLQTCQSQRVEARAWNRVTAKIRMKSTDKLFLLFYNKAVIEKTIAIDNIQLESGDCQSIPPKAVRRRRV